LRKDRPWYKALGYKYIELAFKAAQEADPGATLYYNDYSLNNPTKAQAVHDMVADINSWKNTPQEIAKSPCLFASPDAATYTSKKAIVAVQNPDAASFDDEAVVGKSWDDLAPLYKAYEDYFRFGKQNAFCLS
jgi:hypothetical protein